MTAPLKLDIAYEALVHAENIGVYEYKIVGNYMKYWSFYGDEGFFCKLYNVYTGDTKVVMRIPWRGKDKIQGFLMTETGATKYNYFEG